MKSARCKSCLTKPGPALMLHAPMSNAGSIPSYCAKARSFARLGSAQPLASAVVVGLLLLLVVISPGAAAV